MENFLPVLLLLFFAVCLCIGIYTVSHILGPKNPNASKLSTYECGVEPEGSARVPFKTHFYLVAVLFLLFDVEGVFFIPWAIIYRDSLKEGTDILIAGGLYMALLVLALSYIFRKRLLRLH